MDWTQPIVIIGFTAILTLFFLYHIIDRRIDRIEKYHREDINKLKLELKQVIRNMDKNSNI